MRFKGLWAAGLALALALPSAAHPYDLQQLLALPLERLLELKITSRRLATFIAQRTSTAAGRALDGGAHAP
jgi:hypothetical protein